MATTINMNDDGEHQSGLVSARVEAGSDFGKYNVLLPLGQGGMAEVLLAATHAPFGFHKVVVLKRLLGHVAGQGAHQEMFLDEARILGRLDHPNIVQTFEATEIGNALYIVMEFLQGQSLRSLCSQLAKQGERMHPRMAAKIVCDALRGLHHAHEARDYDGVPLNVVHRDVSPENIFITYEGHVKVLDFGIAKADVRSAHTKAGILKGKVAYMAPEQVSGESVDRRADVFTAGIVLWELLTGRRLMNGGTPAQTLIRLLQDSFATVSSIVPEIDEELSQVVAKALERDPNARYATAQEMREAIEKAEVRSGAPVTQDDIATVMQSRFADRRTKLQREICDRMAAIPTLFTSGTMLARKQLGLPTNDEDGSVPPSSRSPAGWSAHSPANSFPIHVPTQAAVAGLDSLSPPPSVGAYSSLRPTTGRFWEVFAVVALVGALFVGLRRDWATDDSVRQKDSSAVSSPPSLTQLPTQTPAASAPTGTGVESPPRPSLASEDSKPEEMPARLQPQPMVPSTTSSPPRKKVTPSAPVSSAAPTSTVPAEGSAAPFREPTRPHTGRIFRTEL